MFSLFFPTNNQFHLGETSRVLFCIITACSLSWSRAEIAASFRFLAEAQLRTAEMINTEVGQFRIELFPKNYENALRVSWVVTLITKSRVSRPYHCLIKLFRTWETIIFWAQTGALHVTGQHPMQLKVAHTSYNSHNITHP